MRTQNADSPSGAKKERGEKQAVKTKRKKRKKKKETYDDLVSWELGFPAPIDPYLSPIGVDGEHPCQNGEADRAEETQKRMPSADEITSIDLGFSIPERGFPLDRNGEYIRYTVIEIADRVIAHLKRLKSQLAKRTSQRDLFDDTDVEPMIVEKNKLFVMAIRYALSELGFFGTWWKWRVYSPIGKEMARRRKLKAQREKARKLRDAQKAEAAHGLSPENG